MAYSFPKNYDEYRDFSGAADEEVLKGIYIDCMRGRPQEPFPMKLHKILHRCEAGLYSSIISWLPHGRAFKIHKPSLFVEKVMLKYFYQSKMTSFQRQLKMYGFFKLRSGIDKGAYCHELFLYGRLGLCAGIQRRTTKLRIEYAKEPNFYEMPPLNHALTVLSLVNKEPRPIVYASKMKKVKSDHSDKESLISQPQIVKAFQAPQVSAHFSTNPRHGKKPVSNALACKINKVVKKKPTPIKIFRNGIPLTKKQIKTGGFQIATTSSNKLEVSQS